MSTERESMEFDILIVGGGPAGLATAIRAKQKNPELSVCVLEKGSEIGAHILSGAVVDPIALNDLIPDWQEKNCPLNNPVTEDRFLVLGPAGSIRLPNFLMPKLMNNHGCHATSLGNLCRWLAEQAEALGVEVYPGFAAGELIFREDGSLHGVVAGVFGLDREGKPKDDFQPGMELLGRYVVIAEGVRGSLAKELIAHYGLDHDACPQKYGIGIKELWEIDPAKHVPGQVTHSMGWPLGISTGGGSFMYHLENNQVSIGFVVHLNYENPHLSPYEEFQRFKQHPDIRPVLEGGRRVAYGARAISEGGMQSLPKLSFPGGVLVGCAAGMVNVPRIKGSHNAMDSGMMAADAIIEALAEGKEAADLEGYDAALRASRVGRELEMVKNVKPMWSRLGLIGGLMAGGLDMWTREKLGFSFFGTMKHGKADHESLKPASSCKPIHYPKPDGEVSFDRLTNVAFSATNHEEEQPCHLQLKDASVPIQFNLPKYAEPAQRYCPAGVYEVLEKDGAQVFQINAQNCVHCKTCDIKDPTQNIQWRVPEGGGGPNYPNM